jgi:predicted esterase
MASSLAAAQLKTEGFKVELDIEPAVGHTISSTVAQKALAFSGRRSPENGNRRSAGRFPFHER